MAGTTKQTAYGMNAPADLSTPLRRARLSREALAKVFSSLHHGGLVPDLRCNAWGLGLEVLSALARDAGHSHARLSADELPASALHNAEADSPSTASWVLAPGVVSFEADVISLKRVPAGTPVSYGYHYRTERESTLALVSAGYADGVPRTGSGTAQVGVSGTPHPLAGRIAMDQMVLDLGDAEAEIGDTAVIWGDSPTLEQWSQWSGRPPELLVSHLAPRVVKIWS